MGETTKIEWADHTFNPWIGCTKVSPACDNCYAAELMDTRYGRAKWGAGEARVRTAPSNWQQPVKWNRIAARDGTRPFVFCASLADVFDNEVDPVGVLYVWQMMPRAVTQHFPPTALTVIGMLIFGLAMLARLVKQPKLEKPK